MLEKYKIFTAKGPGLRRNECKKTGAFAKYEKTPVEKSV